MAQYRLFDETDDCPEMRGTFANAADAEAKARDLVASDGNERTFAIVRVVKVFRLRLQNQPRILADRMDEPAKRAPRVKVEKTSALL